MPVALEPRNQRPADETGRARHDHSHVTPFLYLSAVVCPVKDGLPLAPPTFEIARFAVLPNRRHMPRDRPPASNLPGVVGGSAAHVVAAIGLEPPTWILLVNPSAATPDGERLRGVHAETIQPRVMPLGAQPGAGEPAPWKFLLVCFAARSTRRDDRRRDMGRDRAKKATKMNVERAPCLRLRRPN